MLLSTWLNASIFISWSTWDNGGNEDAQVIAPNSILSHYHYTWWAQTTMRTKGKPRDKSMACDQGQLTEAKLWVFL